MEGLSVRWGDAFCQSLSLFFAAVLSCRNFLQLSFTFFFCRFFLFPGSFHFPLDFVPVIGISRMPAVSSCSSSSQRFSLFFHDEFYHGRALIKKDNMKGLLMEIPPCKCI